MNFSENKTFCPLPWVNISADTDGSIRLCCVSDVYITKPSGEKYNLGYDKVEDILNSDSLKKIRQDMIDGIPNSGCSRCYNTENNNGISHRKRFILSWCNDPSFVKKYNQSSQSINIENTVEYYDLRYGNLCNLSCRSCYPGASSQFNKDVKQLQDTTKIINFHSPNYNDLNSWYETDMFKYNITSQLPYLKEYYTTGGEPTINEKNYEIIELMIETNDSKHCKLRFNTNLTNSKQKFYSTFQHFKNVQFMASIDGYGDMQEYLRYPSKWEIISNNLEKLVEMNLKNVKIIINPVIQITNLGYIVELFEYLESFNKKYGKRIISIWPIVLENPDYLNLSYLPQDYKMKCWEKIDSWIKNKCVYQDNVFHISMDHIKTKCFMETNYHELLAKFFEFNDIFDMHRNQNLQVFNPELSSLRV